ncbi:hypothetical protein DNK56_14345 [Streptomyces sp. AC1-42W]|nr:hypothetical protein DNK55_17090 [Streptomyces sp. AC1-42T]PZT83108.1 hypothetical protein DNK56_14345 [Streptomyces sp. AC1-42W]
MNPQESWSHHKVLAEEFCLHDEQVRFAEAALREAQMHRSRSLAAFAVTVGRDRSVADLLGLQAREVRSARREVGVETARSAADHLLNAPAAGTEGTGTVWSEELDAALSAGWREGVDLHALAARLGMDVASVVTRLKDLSTQGILRGDGTPTSRGRHRKQADGAPPRPAGRTPQTQSQPQPQAHPHPHPQPREQPAGQGMTESWAEWESQLTPEREQPPAQEISGLVLEGVVCPPYQYGY